MGGVAALLGVNLAMNGAEPALVVFCWRALWLACIASALATVQYTGGGVLRLARAARSPGWGSVLGWIAAIARGLVPFALDESGPFASDGLVGMITPLTSVQWVLALCACLPGRVRRRG